MTRRFSVRTENGEFDGVTAEQLRQWAEQGRVTPNDLVRPEGKQRWFRADAVRRLFPDEQIDLGERSLPQSSPQQHTPARAIRKKPRVLLSLLLLIVPLSTFVFIPAIPLWMGVILLTLAVIYGIPKMRKPVAAVYRVSPDRPVRAGLKLATLGIYGVFLIGLSFRGGEIKEQGQIAREEQIAQKTEEARQLAAANEQVRKMVNVARSLLEAGDIDEAMVRLTNAVRVKKANNHNLARSLLRPIVNAADSDHVFEVLMSLPEDQFTAFRKSGTAPVALNFDYKALTARAVALAEPQFDRAVEKRAERERQRIAAEEARRQQEAERMARVRRAEEVQRQQEAEKNARARLAEQARRQREREAAAAKAIAEAAERARYEKGMGETLSVGYMSYVVWSARWSVRLSSNQFLNKRPNAKWLFLNASVRNNDKKARMVPPFKLVDDQGREYDRAADATMIENAIGMLESLNPDVTTQGLVVFDVPPDRIYRLKVSGGYWSSEDGFIQIKPD